MTVTSPRYPDASHDTRYLDVHGNPVELSGAEALESTIDALQNALAILEKQKADGRTETLLPLANPAFNPALAGVWGQSVYNPDTDYVEFARVAAELTRGSPTLLVGKQADYVKAFQDAQKVPAGERLKVTNIGAGQFPEAYTPNKMMTDVNGTPMTFLESWEHQLAALKKTPDASHPFLDYVAGHAHLGFQSTPESLGNLDPSYQYNKASLLQTLKEVAAWNFATDTGMQDIGPANVVATAGAKPAVHMVCNQFKAGDVVLIPTPCWPTYFDAFHPDVKLVEVPVGDTGYPSVEILNDALAAYPQAKGMLLNVPNNPTGRDFPDADAREATMRRLYEHAQDIDGFMLIDDAPYAKLRLDEGAVDLTRGEFETKLMDEEKLAVIRSQSKEFASPGIRVGTIITKNNELLQHCTRALSTQDGKAIQQTMSIAIMELLFGEPYIGVLRDVLRTNMQDIQRVANGSNQEPGFTLAAINDPEGSLYFTLDLSGWKGQSIAADKLPVSGNDRDANARFIINSPEGALTCLIEACGINAVPGTAAHAPGSPARDEDWTFRLNSAFDLQQMLELLGNVKEVDASLQSPHIGPTPDGPMFDSEMTQVLAAKEAAVQSLHAA